MAAGLLPVGRVIMGTNPTYTVQSLSSNLSVSASFMPVDKFTYQAEYGVLKDAVLETKNAGFTGEVMSIFRRLTDHV